MAIKQAENKLFKSWQNNRAGFVKDGVISEEHYEDSPQRLVFILKEVNDLDGGGWDLREFVRDGGRPQTWNNVARWVHGIRHLPKIFDWREYDEISEDFRRKTLKDICVINLKKSPGTHTTNFRSLIEVAHEDSSLIEQQYSLYQPNFTICCGTGGLFKNVVNHDEYEWRITSKGTWWYKCGENNYVVSFAHPEARVQSSLLLYGLLDAISEICA